MSKNYQFKDLIAFRDVPSLLPGRRQGRPLCPSTVRLWARKGLRGFKLESVKIGGTTYTTESWLKEFIRATGGEN